MTKKWMMYFVVFWVGFVPLGGQAAGTTLSQGDIAIVGYITNGSPDTFSFVNFVPLDSGTVIYFTDNGWTSTQFRGVSSTDGDGNENLIKFTANNTIAVGSVIRSNDSSPNFTWTTSGSIPGTSAGSFANLSLSGSGEQITAVQSGTNNPLFSGYTPIFQIDNTGTFENATSSTEGNIATGLSQLANTAVLFSDTKSYAAFNLNSLNATNKSTSLAAINNSTNWTFNTTSTQLPLPDSPPTISTTTPTNTAINIATNTTIVLNFSENVDLTASAISLECPAGTAKTFTGLPASDVNTVTLTPSAALPNSTACTVTVDKTQVTDKDGTADNMANNYTFTFNTIVIPVGTPPTLTLNTSTTSNYIDGGVASVSSPFATTGTIGTTDTTDPVLTAGVNFTIADGDTTIGSVAVTATSSNTTVVPNGNITVTGSGTADVNVKIQGAAVGYSDITVTANDSSNSTTFIIKYAASAAGMTSSRYHSGKADASTALALDNDYMLVADDEDQTIRLFHRNNSGLPVNGFDLTSNLALTDLSGGVPREVDIEGSTRIGSDIYWLASHSNSSGGSTRPNRYRLIRTALSSTGASSSIAYTSHYSSLRTDLITWGDANSYGFTASAATGKVPELVDGFNIEGFTIAPNGTTAFIGFRAPQVPTSGRVKALIAPISNFNTWASGNFASSPTLGTPIELDLGGRGIRSIECNNNGCLIIAGASDGAGNFKLYRWSGNAADAPVMMTTDLSTTAITGGGNDGSFESIVSMPTGAMNTWAGQTIQVLLDNGDTVYYADSTIAKDLPQANHKKFRSQNITLTEPTITKIHTIQGSGTTAALTGVQTISGIVTKKFPDLTGFFVQEENADADSDPATSEGIFIYDNSNLFTGNVGDLVLITGTATEYTSGSSSSTQLSSLSNVTIISTGNTLPTATTVQIPVASVSDLERFEGMLVNMSSTSGNLVVTETYRLGQYGQITLADGRLEQFTHANTPSTTGYSSHLANIAKHIIYLDDGSTAQNPDPEIFARGGNPLSATNTLRSGDTVSSIIGILDHRYEGYRIQTTSGVNFVATNTRPATPPSVGTPNVKVASFNLLNYFNQFTNCPLGVGGAASTTNCRGAENTAEFTRQKDKHKQVFIGLNADVIGLMELANNGYGAGSAQQDLLDLINSAGLSGRSYKMVDADALIGSTNALGTDAIKIGLLYDDNALDLVAGSVKTSGNAIFDRQPLAATFQHTATGEKFTVVVNHLKSKSSAAGLPGDTDQNDGQGNSNATRTAQAAALVAFLNTLTDDSDILVIGDMNAYRMEDPITTIKNGGYTDLLGSSKYSYVFDGQIGYLDHALASASLVPQITGVDDWHINSDEPSVLDYNTNFKSAGQIAGFYNADPYRSSDHDPVLIGIKLAPKYNLTLIANGSGSISSSGSPAGVSCGLNCLSYLNTTPVNLNATPASGYTFSNWSCTPSFTSGNVLTANTTCTATFTSNPAATTYSLKLETDGNGQGTLGGTAAGTYDEGTTIKLTATPATDSIFKGWSPSSCAATFYLFADTTCTATFETKAIAKVTLSLQIIGQGTLSGTSAGLYPVGTNVQLVATPAANYRFIGWSPANCAVFSLTADTLCVATFETDTPPVNTPPVNILSFNDLLVTLGDADYQIDLTQFFKDAEDPVLSYSINNTQPAVINTTIQANTLNLQFTQVGSSMIEITAHDSGGLSATKAFLVTVASRPLQPPVVPETPNIPITPITPDNSNNAGCELVEHYQGVCNGKGTYLTIQHLTNEAVIANFRIDSRLKNEGFISDMQILPNGVVIGGKLSGEIHNQGIIRNVEFKGKSLEGGTLGGSILNSSPVYGRINHVYFEPCALAEGGYWGGYLTGHAQYPVYLNNLTLAADTVLENAIIGAGVRITGNTKQWRNVKHLTEAQTTASRWDGQQNYYSTACFAPLQDSEFAFVNRPEIAHINKKADILTLAIAADNTHYSFQDSWQTIDAKIEALKIFKTLNLSSMLYLPKQLLVQKPNTILLFLGYRLSTGEIIYQQIE